MGASPSRAASVAGTVPLPSVTPVANSSALGHAANAAADAMTPINLAAYGYAEQEFLVHGNARVFEYADINSLSNAVEVLRSGPYTSRMLIRAPVNPARFSGNVIVELFNDALAGDQITTFPQAQAHILRNGDIWIGITSNDIGIADLKRLNPVRYATLSWANPGPARNAANCSAAPTSTTESGFIYDILSETAALVRSPSASNPLRRYNIRAVYASGYSGSALTLLTYVKAIEPTLASAPFDGYMVSAGLYRQALNECSPSSEVTSRSLVPGSSRAAVFQVQTPSEVTLYRLAYLGAAFPQQPDSDSSNGRYRFYEIAGSSHVDETLIRASPSNADDEAEFGTTINVLTAGCKQPGKVSSFPDLYVYDNLWAKLEGWVRNGASPPHATPLTGFDGLGNETGGVRSPAVDVPVATYLSGSVYPATSQAGPVSLPCSLLGYEVDYSPQDLTVLYGNKAHYVTAVQKDADALYAQGFLEQPDAEAIISAANAVSVPSAK